jgi:hypothetical protein
VTPPPSSSSQRTPLPFRQATPLALSIAHLSHCHVATPAASPHRHAAAPNLLYDRRRSPPLSRQPQTRVSKFDLLSKTAHHRFCENYEYRQNRSVFSTKFKNKFKQNSANQNDKSISFSYLLIGFIDLSIDFLTHRSVLSSKMIYRSVFRFIHRFSIFLIFFIEPVIRGN